MLDHMVAIFLVFQGTFILFPIVTVPVYIPTECRNVRRVSFSWSVGGFPFHGGSFKSEGYLFSFIRKGTLGKEIHLISSLYEKCVCTKTRTEAEGGRKGNRQTSLQQ